MPAKSKQQQKFFGVVRAMQKGDIPKKGEAGEVADDMKKTDVKKMAKTKHKGLPKKVTKKEIKEMILQEIVKELKLNEVKPFVDNKLRNIWDYPLGNKEGLVYLATNDHRYPTEIVVYNMNRDVFHFLHSQSGDWKKATQETVPRKGFNSTHWVIPYFEEWEEDFDYEKGFKESRLNEAKNVDTIKRRLVKTIDAMKKNIEKFKKAKDDKEKKKYAKIAYKLQDDKKKLEKSLDDAILGIHADAELEIEEGKVNEGAMSDIDIIRQNSDDLEQFIRNFDKTYGHKLKMSTKVAKWLKGLWDMGQEVDRKPDLDKVFQKGRTQSRLTDEGKLNEANIWDETGDAQDKKFFNELIERMKKIYSTIAPKTYNIDNFEKDLEKAARKVIEPEMEQYAQAKKPFGKQTPEERTYTRKVWVDWLTEVDRVFRTTSTFSGHKGIRNKFISNIGSLFKVLMMAAGGDTSSMGYKVMKRWKDTEKAKHYKKFGIGEGKLKEVKINNKEVDVNTIEIEGVDRSEGPDDGTVDAFASYAEFYNGGKLNDNQLDKLTNENPDLIHNLALKMFEGKINEAAYIDIEHAVKDIKKFNRGTGSDKTFEAEDLAISILGNLGFKLTKTNIQNALDHLYNSMENNTIPEDPQVVKELYPLMESKKKALTEGRYDHMVGRSFKLPGRGNSSMKITRIEDDRFVHASPYEEWAKYGADKASSAMFKIQTVIQHNPEIDEKPKVKRTAWNKGTGDPNLISKREYAKILMGAMKDMKSMGDEEHTHDVAQSMIYDAGILARLTKDYPGKNTEQLTQQLQWDLEAAA